MMKRYVAEFLGTFGIVFAPVALSAANSTTGVIGAALVSGLSVIAMIYALGPISAAHFNPAVTLGFAVAKRFPWKFVLPYWLAQFLGAIVAAGLVTLMSGSGHGIHIPVDPTQIIRNVLTEVVLTFLLMLVIISVATDKRVSGTVPALAIGFAVVFLVLVGAGVTGGSMNPARSFGPAVFAGGPALTNYWLYLIAPMIGAPIGALVYEKIRLEPEHAKGAPNELWDALQEIAVEK